MTTGAAFEQQFSPGDSELLASARRGSDSALGAILQAYRAYLGSIAFEELGSDLRVKASASDLVQESFLEAQRDFQSFAGESPEQFRVWLRRILLNNIASTARMFRQTSRRDLGLETRPGEGEISDLDGIVSTKVRAPDDLMECGEVKSSIMLALQKLPEHYREVIILRNYDRLSFEEIGKQIERSSEASRKLWVRALDALSRELEMYS